MKTVAVIGASTNRAKFGNKAVRAFAEAGYRVIPITPRHAEVEGLPAYPAVTDVPGPIDMVTIYVPPEVGETLVAGLAAKGVGEVWLNPGAESPDLVARLTAAGLAPIEACSIVGIGLSPARF
ncbi:MAG: CoA-binding protein [Vicinamibacterales bacterium]